MKSGSYLIGGMPFGNHYIQVIVQWHSTPGRFNAYMKRSGLDASSNAFGSCTSLYNKKARGDRFIVVNLVSKDFKASYAAHELVHAGQSLVQWHDGKYVSDERKNNREQLAYAVQDMTRLFWNAFYTKLKQRPKLDWRKGVKPNRLLRIN